MLDRTPKSPIIPAGTIKFKRRSTNWCRICGRKHPRKDPCNLVSVPERDTLMTRESAEALKVQFKEIEETT